MARKYSVRLNSIEKIEELLQEIYDQACRQLNEIQNEMNKLQNSTNLGDDSVSIDEKAKYSKAMHDFLGDKDRAIKSKFEIAKFMGEIVKHQGDVNETLNDANVRKNSGLNLKSLKDSIEKDGGTMIYNVR